MSTPREGLREFIANGRAALFNIEAGERSEGIAEGAKAQLSALEAILNTMPEERWRLSPLQTDHVRQLGAMGATVSLGFVENGGVDVTIDEHGALVFTSCGEPNATQRVEPVDG